MRANQYAARNVGGMLGRLTPLAIATSVWLAFYPAALGHGRDEIPTEAEALAQYQAGLQAYYNEDYGAALDAWRPLAGRRHGSSAAQLFLGFMHANGLGVDRDAAEAAKWYERAARQGHPLAQVRLAILYRGAAGLDRDLVKAHAWAALAARDEDHVDGFAKALLAALEGQMTPKQVTEAKALAADLAAAQGAEE